MTFACCAAASLSLLSHPLGAQTPLSCIDEVNVSLDAQGMALLNPEDFLREEAPGADLEISPPTVSCEDIGGMSESFFTVTDMINGNACFGRLIVADRSAPTPVCMSDVDVLLDEEGLGFLDPEDIDGGSFDNCSSEPMLSLDRSEFTCDDVGPQDIQLDVIDDFGNTEFCRVTINVIENGACSGTDCVKNPNRAGYWVKKCLTLDYSQGGLGKRLYRNLYHKNRAEKNFDPELVETVGAHLDDLFEQSGLSACQDGLKAESKYGSCDRALRQLTTLLFNIESGRLTKICPICLNKNGTRARTIGQLVNEIAEYIKAGECGKALKIASKINKGRGLDCDQTVGNK